MNNLEFIEKEIKEFNFQIEYIKSNMKKYVDYKTEGQLKIDQIQLKLNHFQQIKCELEAWESIKEDLEISKDRVPFYGEVKILTLRIEEIENADNIEKINKIEKAVGIKDE